MITGQFQTVKFNNYGYPSIKVGGTWYGGDKKVKPTFSEGDLVELDAYKNAKGYDTYKTDSLKLVTAQADVKTAGPAIGAVTYVGAKTPYGQKEGYWANKAVEDKAKEPKIAYFASLERAIAYIDLAIRAGAFKALEKAKDADKLAILEAFVTETTQRFIDESYVAASTEAQQNAEAESSKDEAPAQDAGKWQ